MTSMDRPTVKFGDLDLTSNSFVFTISREMAIQQGYEKPTPEEVERYNAESRARWEAAVAQWALLDAAADELAAIDDPLARRILNLHASEDAAAECVACSEYGDDEAYPVDWPCLTVVNIAEHFGIDLPDGQFGSRPGNAPYEMPPEGYQPFVVPLARWHTALGEAFDSAVFTGDEPA